MAYYVTVVPTTSGTEAGLQQFIVDTVGTDTLVQILERGPRLVLVWKDH